MGGTLTVRKLEGLAAPLEQEGGSPTTGSQTWTSKRKIRRGFKLKCGAAVLAQP